MLGKRIVWLKQRNLVRGAGDDERIPADDLTRSLAAVVVGEAEVSELVRQSSIQWVKVLDH